MKNLSNKLEAYVTKGILPLFVNMIYYRDIMVMNPDGIDTAVISDPDDFFRSSTTFLGTRWI